MYIVAALALALIVLMVGTLTYVIRKKKRKTGRPTSAISKHACMPFYALINFWGIPGGNGDDGGSNAIITDLNSVLKANFMFSWQEFTNEQHQFTAVRT